MRAVEASELAIRSKPGRMPDLDKRLGFGPFVDSAHVQLSHLAVATSFVADSSLAGVGGAEFLRRRCP